MGYFMSVTESVANGFFLGYFFVSLDQVYYLHKSARYISSLIMIYNGQIVKWLKSPNGANIGCEELTGVALTANVETLVPRVGVGVLRRTPIGETRKTTNH